MTRRFEFLVFLALAIGLTYVPVLSVPLKWFEVLFHESSHALAAVLTGGSVEWIELNWDGSGLAATRGNMLFLTAFSGYAGAIAWGALLYAMGSAMAHNTARLTTGILLVLATLEALFWLKADVASYAITGVLMAILALMLHPRAARLAKPLLRLIGAFVLVSAIVSPSYLLAIGDSQPNDALSLAKLTGVPAVVWSVGWMGLGVLAAGLLFWWEGKLQKSQAFYQRLKLQRAPHRWWRLGRG